MSIPHPQSPIRLDRMRMGLSGHCHRVELLLSMLELPQDPVGAARVQRWFYAYAARAPEGGVSLAHYPAIRAWLQRVEALPRFVAMPVMPRASKP